MSIVQLVCVDMGLGWKGTNYEVGLKAEGSTIRSKSVCTDTNARRSEKTWRETGARAEVGLGRASRP